MNNTLHIYRKLLAFIIPLFILLFLVALTQSSILKGNDTLSLAITVDLLLTIPIVYFLLIRKTTIPKSTVILALFIGLIIGSFFLPTENQTYLSLFKSWGLPLIELCIITLVIFKIRSAIIQYKKLKGTMPDFFTALKSTCYSIFPKNLAMIVTTEIAVIYYGFLNWSKQEIKENEFTYHIKSGSPALLYVLILIISVEAVAIHFLLALWSEVIAWILTALSAYTAIQVFGLARSLSKRPIVVGQHKLTLKYGILNEVDIPYSDIEVIEQSRKPLDKNLLNISLSPLGELESHNMIIYLKKEHQLIGLYGLKKKFKVITLYVDEVVDFKQRIEAHLE